MKTFDKKDVITCVNAEDAKKYIGKLGYFANGLNGFSNIDYFAPYSLDNVQVGIDKPFFYREKNFALFLPEDKVKEVKKEKKWRAFRTFEEFILVLGTIGCHVRFRFKDDISNEFLALIVGFNYEAQTVTINNSIYSFKELFKKFEFYKNQEWQPFGVLDES